VYGIPYIINIRVRIRETGNTEMYGTVYYVSPYIIMIYCLCIFSIEIFSYLLFNVNLLLVLELCFGQKYFFFKKGINSPNQEGKGIMISASDIFVYSSFESTTSIVMLELFCIQKLEKTLRKTW
jgi:hypothetical protein